MSLLAIIPGPAKEFRNLPIATVIPEKEVDKLDRSYQMEIYGLRKNGVTCLVKKGYKMVKRYHLNVIEMSEFHVLDFHLKRYVKHPQLKLIPGGEPITFALSTSEGNHLDHHFFHQLLCKNLLGESCFTAH